MLSPVTGRDAGFTELYTWLCVWRLNHRLRIIWHIAGKLDEAVCILHKLEKLILIFSKAYFHPQCLFPWGHCPTLPNSPEHHVFFHLQCREERKHSQSRRQAKSSDSLSFCCGVPKEPRFMDKDLQHVRGGRLGREKIITGQQLLCMTCFPGNLAALQAESWIGVEELKCLKH